MFAKEILRNDRHPLKVSLGMSLTSTGTAKSVKLVQPSKALDPTVSRLLFAANSTVSSDSQPWKAYWPMLLTLAGTKPMVAKLLQP